MLFSNALRYGLARGLSAIVNFLALAVFTRLLGKEGYGWYALAMASVALGYAALYQWLSLATVRLLNADVAPRRLFQQAVLRSFLRIGLGIIPAVLLCLLVGPAFLPRTTVAIAAVLFFAQSWYELNLMVVTADSRPDRYGLLSVVRAVGSLSVGGALALAGYGPNGVLLGVCIGYLIPGLWLAHGSWPSARGAENTRAIESVLLRFGAPLVGTYVLDYIVSTSDRLLIGVLQGAGPAGSYAAAYDLTQQSVWTLLMVVNLAAYPMAVAAAEASDRKAFAAHCRRHLGLLLGLAVPAGAGLAVLAPGIASVMFGPEIAGEAAQLIPIIALAVVLGGIKAYYFDLSFQLSRSTIYQLAVVVIAALVNLGLNIAWIPALGARGAALATLSAYALGLGLSVILGRRVLPLPVPGLDIARIVLATAGMAAVLWEFRAASGLLPLALLVLGGGVVYLGLILALNPGQVRSGLAAAWRARA
jgi:O-antigen/teichoic acid export membrane protein